MPAINLNPTQQDTENKTLRNRLNIWWYSTSPGQKAVDILLKGSLAIMLLGAGILTILGLAGAAGLAAGVVAIGTITAPIWAVAAVSMLALAVIGYGTYKAYQYSQSRAKIKTTSETQEVIQADDIAVTAEISNEVVVEAVAPAPVKRQSVSVNAVNNTETDSSSDTIQKRLSIAGKGTDLNPSFIRQHAQTVDLGKHKKDEFDTDMPKPRQQQSYSMGHEAPLSIRRVSIAGNGEDFSTLSTKEPAIITNGYNFNAEQRRFSSAAGGEELFKTNAMKHVKTIPVFEEADILPPQSLKNTPTELLDNNLAYSSDDGSDNLSLQSIAIGSTPSEAQNIQSEPLYWFSVDTTTETITNANKTTKAERIASKMAIQKQQEVQDNDAVDLTRYTDLEHQLEEKPFGRRSTLEHNMICDSVSTEFPNDPFFIDIFKPYDHIIFQNNDSNDAFHNKYLLQAERDRQTNLKNVHTLQEKEQLLAKATQQREKLEAQEYISFEQNADITKRLQSLTNIERGLTENIEDIKATQEYRDFIQTESAQALSAISSNDAQSHQSQTQSELGEPENNTLSFSTNTIVSLNNSDDNDSFTITEEDHSEDSPITSVSSTTDTSSAEEMSSATPSANDLLIQTQTELSEQLQDSALSSSVAVAIATSTPTGLDDDAPNTTENSNKIEDNHKKLQTPKLNSRDKKRLQKEIDELMERGKEEIILHPREYNNHAQFFLTATNIQSNTTSAQSSIETSNKEIDSKLERSTTTYSPI